MVTQVFSIFERIGLGGGGKVKAVYHRMNALSEMAEFDPVLLVLDHNPRQRLNFSTLQADGAIAPRVKLLTVPEACHSAAVAAGVQPYADFPDWDDIEQKAKKTVYRRDGVIVMTDRVRETTITDVVKRTVERPEATREYMLIDNHVHQCVAHNSDGTVETTDFVRSLPIRWVKTKDRNFVVGRNLVTDTICRMPRIYAQNIFSNIEWGRSLVFFDGVTSAYLAPVTNCQRALFLHADHRSPEGHVVPRSKFLIENFKGEAIITSTQVHKAQIEADVAPSADLHVIPHFCDTKAFEDEPRQHLVTVSRLELTGKPIDECITAFALIMDAFPQVDYLIYGVGAGRKQLEVQIDALGCGDRIRLMGYTQSPLRVFQRAVASVYPTTTEGFGLSILEALSNGCPVISYDVNYGPREMVVSGQNGELVQRGDIKAIAEAMEKVLRDSEHYQEGTSSGLERYTRETYLNNYRNLVRALVPLKTEKSTE